MCAPCSEQQKKFKPYEMNVVTPKTRPTQLSPLTQSGFSHAPAAGVMVELNKVKYYTCFHPP